LSGALTLGVVGAAAFSAFAAAETILALKKGRKYNWYWELQLS